jgi:hypothetical protein
VRASITNCRLGPGREEPQEALAWQSFRFGMHRGEMAAYLCAAALIPTVIHVAFILFLGWKEYLPFWAVPSLGELLS